VSTIPPSGPGEPEYLGSHQDDPGPTPADHSGPAAKPTGRRTAVLGLAAVGVTAALTAGGWGVLQLMSNGGSAAEAVPSTAIGYLSVNLDPSAGQKIEAVRTLQKFPGIAESLDIDATDDVRRYVFEQIQDEIGCDDLDYGHDVEPWLGDRMAVAAVPDSDQPVAPLVVLQVGDQQAARAGIDALASCGGTEEAVGVAFAGEYMLLTEHQDDADAFAAAAEAKSLAETDQFDEWMGRVGDPGIVTGYASADAADVMLSAMESAAPHEPDTFAEGDLECKAPCSGVSVDVPGSDEYMDLLRKQYRNFEGMAGVIRFDDGAVEAEFVTRGMDPTGALATGVTAPSLADLPESTALAFGFGVPDTLVKDSLDVFDDFFGAGPGSAGLPSMEEMLARAEAQTGLKLPEDIQTLLGDGITISVDAGADLRALSQSPDPDDIPVGLRIDGDPAKIRPVLDKLLAAAGPAADFLVVKSTDSGVVLGLQQRYVETLAAGGSLGDVSSFQRVVPEADRANSALYVNFDAGAGWLEELGRMVSDGDKDVAANLAPLDAVGISGWTDDDAVQHGLVALTTD
jgi:hypothetical protein